MLSLRGFAGYEGDVDVGGETARAAEEDQR